MGIQSGLLYSVQEHLAAPDFLRLLNQKIAQDAMERAVSADRNEDETPQSQLALGIDFSSPHAISDGGEEMACDIQQA